MTRGKFKDIVEKISIQKNLSYTAIAETAGIGRSNFSTILNNDPEKPVQRKTLERIKNSFPEFFEQNEQFGTVQPDFSYAKFKKQPPQKEGVAVDIGNTLIKMEGTLDVMFSVLAELLAGQKGQVGTIVQKELEREVKNRIDFLEQRRLKA